MQFVNRAEELETPRLPTQINLLDEVVAALRESTLFNYAMVLETHFIQHDLVDKQPNVQRFYMNKWFNTQLLSIEADSSAQRFCLVNDGTIADWLHLFKVKILPFLREHSNG